MRIGFYGGIANNMYVFAKAFKRHGHDVLFIRDRGGLFGFSQPLWDDVRYTLEYGELAQSYQWSWEEWAVRERQLQWRAPDWLADPFDIQSTAPLIVRTPFSGVDTALLRRIALGQRHWRAVVDLMQRCDVLLVCGIEGELLALASSRPFAIWTHGGDLRTAAGFHPPQSRRWPEWRHYLMQQRLLRLAFKRALFVGSYDPLGFGGHVGRIPRRFKIVQCPIPVQVAPRLPKAQRRFLLAEVMQGVGQAAPAADYVLFVPSRVDFYWKGMDRLLRALSRVENAASLHVIVSGWGRDYESARRMVSREMVTFLPCALSRPVLHDFFRAVDLVADQFLLGTYGTGAVEAMGVGTPVMMWFDDEPLLARGWEPPPVLNARTEVEIAGVLSDVIAGRMDLDERAHQIHEWVARVHGEDVVVPALAERFRRALGVS